MKKIFLLCTLMAVCLNTNAQTSTGPQTVTAAANNTSTNTVSWTILMNPALIASVFYNNQMTKGLNLTGFGFAVPGTATIVGVAATTSYSGSTVGTASATTKDTIVRLLKAGVETGNNLGGTNTYAQACGIQNLGYGSNSNLWGTTLTPADVNANNFGYVVYLKGGAGAEYVINTYTNCSNFSKTSMTVYYITSSGVVESQTAISKIYSFGKNLYLNDFANENSALEVYNLIGEKVYSTTIEKNQKQADLSNLNTGVYIYKLKLGDKELCKKFAIE